MDAEITQDYRPGDYATISISFKHNPENPKWMQVEFSDGEIWTVSGERLQHAFKEFVRTYGMLKVT